MLVSDKPIIPLICADDTGVDILPTAQLGFDRAMATANGSNRSI
jgi:isocitrate dehydrogenase